MNLSSKKTDVANFLIFCWGVKHSAAMLPLPDAKQDRLKDREKGKDKKKLGTKKL